MKLRHNTAVKTYNFGKCSIAHIKSFGFVKNMGNQNDHSWKCRVSSLSFPTINIDGVLNWDQVARTNSSAEKAEEDRTDVSFPQFSDFLWPYLFNMVCS